MARSRSQDVKPIGVRAIAPVVAFLEKHGIGMDEFREAWLGKGGLEELVQLTARRAKHIAGDQVAKTETTTPHEPNTDPATAEQTIGGRKIISSWDEFLYYWNTCRTQQEAIGLLMVCSVESDSHIQSLHLNQMQFLINVSNNDPDPSVRKAAYKLAWDFLCFRAPLYPPLELLRESGALQDALRFVADAFSGSHNDASFTGNAGAQFLCGAAYRLVISTSETPNEYIENALVELTTLSYRLEQFVLKNCGTYQSFGSDETRRDRSSIVATLRYFVHNNYFTPLDLGWESAGESSRPIHVPLRALAQVLRAFFENELLKKLSEAPSSRITGVALP